MCALSTGLGEMMALGVLLLLAAVVAVQGIDPRVPPKFVRAAYGLQKALYAENFGYSLVPLPNNILAHLNKSKSISPTSRVGRSRKAYRPRSRRRRRRRPRPTKYRRPNSYGVSMYAKRYKQYLPRRPYRYKKRNRLRPNRWHRDPEDFDYYEQDISDYDDYPGDYDYDRSIYDRDFINRHAELYNGGYNPGFPRGKMRENKTQYPEESHQVQYFHDEDDRWEDFRIPLAPKRERDKPIWSPQTPWPSKPKWSSRPFSAAIAAPSRPVTLREPTNHKTFNWDPKSSSYKVVENKRPPSYDDSYSDEYDPRHRFRDGSRDPYFNFKRADAKVNQDEDIGFGQGMEMVDDRFTGWTVS